MLTGVEAVNLKQFNWQYKLLCELNSSEHDSILPLKFHVDFVGRNFDNTLIVI